MHTYICMHIYTYACTSILFTIHIHMLTQLHTHRHIHTHTVTDTFTHTLSHTHNHTDTHTLPHTLTHTHAFPPGTELVLAEEVTGPLGSPSPSHGSSSRASPSLGPAVLWTQTVQQLLCRFFGLSSRLFISLPVIRCSPFGDISK